MSIIDDDDCLPTGSQHTPGIDCTCPTHVNHRSSSITCLACAKPVQVTCLVNQYKIATDTALKNHEGLAGFIGFLNLRYYCKACLQSSPDIGKPLAGISMSHTATTTPDSVAAQVNNLEVKVSDIGQQLSDLKQVIATFAAKSTAAVDMPTQGMVDVKKSIAALDSKLQALHESIANPQAGKCEASISNSQVPKECRPLTYASAISADVVKSVVSETIKEQQKVNTANASLVVKGFPEEGNDYVQLLDMFQYLYCKCDVISPTRIGNQDYSKSKMRPIKVVLSQASNASVILRRAKQLSYNEYYESTFISRWVPDEKMLLFRRQRDALNQEHPANKNGRKQFAISSGEIKQRDSKGRLQTYRGLLPTVPVAPGPRHPPRNVSSAPKTGAGGSQVAPHTQP